jgi:membrane-bound lytic murein transglycosylase D
MGPAGVAAFTAAAARTDTRADLVPEDPSIPSEMLDLMNRSQLRYQEGLTLIKSGETAKARAAYDAAVDMILKSSWSVAESRALDRYFQDLIARIHEDEARFLPQVADEHPESAVVDELDKVDLIPITVDPKVREIVEADIANTRYDVPVMLNERVLKSLNFWLSRGRRFFVDGLTRSGRYREMIHKAFKEASVPLDVMYLAQVESLFKTNALSRAQCKGIWQFGKGTAVRYGLKVNNYVDERSDPEKSTRAAARYLTDLYQMFGDWNLVLAAYNWGEGKVQRLMDRSGLDDFWDLAELGKKRKLPAETKNHVPLIMASIILAHNPEKYGLPTVLESPVATDIAMLSHSIDLRAAAKLLDVPVEDLKQLNPELRGFVTPAEPDGYRLRVPSGTALETSQQIASLPVAKLPPPVQYARHKVKSGETLTQIAAKYKVSVAALQSANRIAAAKPLRAGTVLEIPARRRAPAQTLSAQSKPPARRTSARRPAQRASSSSAHKPLSAKGKTPVRKKPAPATAQRAAAH